MDSISKILKKRLNEMDVEINNKKQDFINNTLKKFNKRLSNNCSEKEARILLEIFTNCMELYIVKLLNKHKSEEEIRIVLNENFNIIIDLFLHNIDALNFNITSRCEIDVGEK